MEVGKIQQNISKGIVNKGKPVAFSGAMKAVHNQRLRKITEQKMSPLLRDLKKFEFLKGEVGGILITAIGTGLVAPIFIAFNPLSKKDEDTKKYTALRQPVSALLTILIQIGLTTPLSKLYDMLSNKGILGKNIDLSHEKLHSDAYYKKEVEVANKGKKLNPDVLEREVEASKIENVRKVATELRSNGCIEYSNGRKIDGTNISSLIKDALAADILEQKDIISEISDENTVAKSKRAFVLLTKDSSEKNVIGVLCNQLKGVSSRDEALHIIDDWTKIYVKDDADLKEIANEFVRRVDLNDLKERAIHTIEKINIFEKALVNSKVLAENADEIISKLAVFEKASPEDRAKILDRFEQIAGKRLGQQEVGGLHQIVDALRNLDDEKAQNKYISSVMARIKDFAVYDGNMKETLRVYQEGYYHDKKLFAKTRIKLLEAVKNGIADKIDDVRKTLSDIAERLKLADSKDFSENVVGQLRNKIEKNVKGFKQVTNILVGFFITLPLTCSALNWLYPRFMEVFFPELANSKKSDAPEEKAKEGGKK